MAAFSAAAVPDELQQRFWLTDSAISPDGRQIAFRFDGDLYLVPATGGDARLIVGGPGLQRAPVWMPSSDVIAYASNSVGNDDVFVVEVERNDIPKRITWHGYDETPLYVSLDGKTVFYKSARADLTQCRSVYPPHAYWRKGKRLFAKPLEGGLPRVVLDPDVFDATPLGATEGVLFVEKPGVENVFRKHDRSPATLDIWVKDADGIAAVALSDSHDANPVWSDAAGKMYFLSERGGSQNVWKQSLNGATEPQQVTFHERHSVRDLSISRDGTLAYAFHGDIFVGQGQDTFSRLEIRLPDATPQEKKLNHAKDVDTTMQVTQALELDEDTAVLTVGGAAFIVARSDALAKPLFDDERCVISDLALSQDRRTLFAVCDRGRATGFLTVTLPIEATSWADSINALTTRGFGFKDDVVFDASLSPDGRRAAILTSKSVKLIELESGRLRTLITRGEGYYEHQQNIAWHPSSEYIAMEWTGNQRAVSDVVVIRVADGTLYNVTNSGFDDSAPHWTRNGQVLTWLSNRDGLRDFQEVATSDLYALFFTPQAAEAYHRGRSQPAQTLTAEDFHGQLEATIQAVQSRRAAIVRLTASNTNNPVMLASPGLDYATWLREDGEVWLQPLPDGDDTMVVSISMDDRASADSVYSMQNADNDHELFIDAKGTAGWVDMAAGHFDPVPEPAPVAQTAANRLQSHRWIFERAVRSVREGYYRSEYLDEIDWDGYVDEYRPFLDSLTDPYEFAQLMEELLGELNSSHTGFDYSDPAHDEQTFGSLGVIYDSAFAGPGWKVAEFLPGSPLAKAMPEVGLDSVIRAVDDIPIEKSDDPAERLMAKAGEAVEITIEEADGRLATSVVRPVDLQAEGEMLYRRWAAWNEAEVTRLSDGKLGYAHMRNMRDAAFRSMLDAVVGRHVRAEGIVLDLRYNSGGWMHGPLISFLSAPYAFSLRAFGTVYASEPVLRMDKPFNVLVNSANYSNGSEVPALIQKQALAPLIGEPIAGTGLGGIDFEIPFRGYDGSYAHDISLTADGDYWENTPVIPDVVVRSRRTEKWCNRDSQLEAAVAELLARTAR